MTEQPFVYLATPCYGGMVNVHFMQSVLTLQAACAELGGCATGDAKATPAFDLPARWIIHAVGPRYRDGAHGEPELLASCYRRVLEVADFVAGFCAEHMKVWDGVKE